MPGAPAPPGLRSGPPSAAGEGAGGAGLCNGPPRRRRRPRCRAAVGVCSGGRGLGVASARAPRAPCYCLGPCRLSPARLPSALSLSQFVLSPESRLPTLARSHSPSLPPSLAHKQDGGCCFFPLPNPPYGLAVAEAAGNEPRGGKGEGLSLWREAVRGRSLGPSRSHNGGSGPVGGASTNHGIRPRPQRCWRFRKLPRSHPAAPFKGEDLKGGGSGTDLKSIFSRWTLTGEGAWVGSLRRGPVGTAPGKAPSYRAGSRKGAVGVALRPRPLSRRSFLPRFSPPVRG